MVVRASAEFRKASRRCFRAAVVPHGKFTGVASSGRLLLFDAPPPSKGIGIGCDGELLLSLDPPPLGRSLGLSGENSYNSMNNKMFTADRCSAVRFEVRARFLSIRIYRDDIIE